MEFALVSSAFVMMLLATIDIGRYFFTAEAVRTVTAEAARASLITYRNDVNSNCPSSSAMETAAITRSPFLGANLLDLTVTCSTSGPKVITVTTSYPFQLMIPWIPLSTNITDSSRLVVEPNG